jgi:hypothetical protein
MGLCKKVPLYFVLPSESEASLTSFGTALRDVFPRHASAEGPLASLGATKKCLGATTEGLAQIFKTASNKPIAFIFRFVIF